MTQLEIENALDCVNREILQAISEGKLSRLIELNSAKIALLKLLVDVLKVA